MLIKNQTKSLVIIFKVIKHKFPPILTPVHPCSTGVTVQCIVFYSSNLYNVHTQSKSSTQIHVSQTQRPLVPTAWPPSLLAHTEDSSCSYRPGALSWSTYSCCADRCTCSPSLRPILSATLITFTIS